MDLFHLLFLFVNYSILYTVSMSVKNKLCCIISMLYIFRKYWERVMAKRSVVVIYVWCMCNVWVCDV